MTNDLCNSSNLNDGFFASNAFAFNETEVLLVFGYMYCLIATETKIRIALTIAGNVFVGVNGLSIPFIAFNALFLQFNDHYL